MTRKELKRAMLIEACIKSAEHNLKRYEKIKEANEIKIEINSIDGYLTAIYLSGENKETIMDALIIKEKKWLNDNLSKLEKI